MSTDKPIPERWRVASTSGIIELKEADYAALGMRAESAESLVRDLAMALRDVRMQLIEGHVGEAVLGTVCAALSRIPKELRDAK